MTQDTKLTFQQQIEQMRNDERQTQIDTQAAASRAKDEANTKAALKALFLTNTNKLPSGSVVDVQEGRITVQLVASLAVKYPKAVDEHGKIVVACVQTLSIVDNKPVYSNIPAEVGQKGLVDSLFSGGQYRLILDNRQEAAA